MIINIDLNLVCEIRQRDGSLIARFQLASKYELFDFQNAEHLSQSVLVNVKNLRLFIGNAVIVQE